MFFIIITSLLPVFAVQQFSRWINTQPYHILEEINALGLEIVKPEYRDSAIDYADRSSNTTPVVPANGISMLSSTVKIIHPRAKKKLNLELETIVSDREISLDEK